MNATQLEALVMQAVDTVKAGANPEDDRIEFKRAWPEVEKARQLAAAANQAQGDHVIYVIGVDDRTGEIHPLGNTDPATWWAQFEARFDEVAPELMRHITVSISAEERVVALLFRTDRAPYVVKGKGDGAELEVPIRAGTRTRSAKRHELIRMLYPAASVPQLTILDGTLRLSPPQYYGGDSDEELMLSLTLEILFEHAGATPSFMPFHAAQAHVASGDYSQQGRIHSYAPPDSSPASAIHVRRDGIRVAETGVAHLLADWTLPRSQIAALGGRSEWTASVDLGVSGSPRSATASVKLDHRSEDVEQRIDGESVGMYEWKSQGQDTP